MKMTTYFICPKPIIWNDIYQQLKKARENKLSQQPSLPEPPIPLILGGWVYSNDAEKRARWEKTVEWANIYGFDYLIPEFQPDEVYSVSGMSTYEIGPLGGPLYLPWNFEPRLKPSQEEAENALIRLKQDWQSVVGSDLAEATHPLKFTGKKLRRLVVQADANVKPPWGTWMALDPGENRRAFTEFRSTVNKQIHPLFVDHIDFIPVEDLDQPAKLQLFHFRIRGQSNDKKGFGTSRAMDQ